MNRLCSQVKKEKLRSYCFCVLLMLAVVLNTALGTAAYAEGGAMRIHVSPDGNDITGDGSEGNPYLTISKAQAVLRANKPATMTEDYEIVLRGGTYELDNTLTLTSADSGNNGFYVVYRAYPGEHPVISGGKTLTGWTLHSGNIYKAAVPDGFDTRQLYVDGVRAARARSESNPAGFSKNWAAKAYNLPASGFYANMAAWGNQGDIELYTPWSWKHTRLAVKDISGGKINVEPKSWDFAHTQAAYTGSSIVHIENAYELLDEPGEWYLDRTADLIYYIPRAGEDLASAEVVAGHLETIVSAEGTAGAPVENVKFDGITFSYNTWLLPNGELGYPDFQTGVIYATEPWVDGEWFTTNTQTPGALQFWYTRNSIVENCTITHTGNAGIALREGSAGNLITQNTISDTSGNGITLGEITIDAHRGVPAAGIVEDNTISFNTVTRVGAEFVDNVGIFVGYTQNTVVDHNDVYDIPYTGISVGWGWGYIENALGFTPIAGNNTVSNNKVHGFMKNSNDGGGIYTLGRQPGTQIYNNHLYDIGNTLFALYRDNGSSGIMDTNNVVDGGTSSIRWYSSGTGPVPYDPYDTYGNSSYFNYYTDGMSINLNSRNAAMLNTPVTSGAWPAEAQAVMQNAGVNGNSAADPTAYFYDLNGTESIGMWNLNETSGSVAANRVAGGVPGTTSGTTQWVEGKQLNGLQLSSGGALTIADTKATIAFTAALWVKLDSLPASGLHNIAAKTNGDASVISHQLAVDAQGKVHARLGGADVVSADPLAPGEWYHLALTADSKGSLTLYVDGEQQAASAVNDVLWNSGDQKYGVGHISNAAPGMVGTVDQLQIYGKVLTASELQDIYHRESGPVNLALFGTATASTFYGAGYEADKAIDDDRSTRWAAASGRTGNEWVTVDLLNETAVQEIQAEIYNPAGRTFEYKFEYSTDNTTWNAFGNAADTTVSEQVYSALENPVNARYIRMTIIDSDGTGCSIYELGVFGSKTARSPNLEVTNEIIFSAQLGYTPAARTIAIANNGNVDATIASVTVDSANFTISGSGATVPAEGSIDTWKILPVAGLAVGTYNGTITVTYDGGKTAAGSVSFTVTPQKVNAALSSNGGIATASSHYTPLSGYTADMAIDNDMNTRWAAEAGRVADEWIMVTLPQTKSIDEVRVVAQASHVKYKIEYSLDGEEWDIFVPSTETTVSDNSYVLDTPVMAKYMKLTYIDSFNQGCSVWEFAVYEEYNTPNDNGPYSNSSRGGVPAGAVELPDKASDTAKRKLEELMMLLSDLPATE